MTESAASESKVLAGVLLELGKTLLVCQAYEGTLCLLLLLITREENGEEEGAFNAALDLYSQKTLGQLLKQLAQKLDVSGELRNHLTVGWERRNVVVHRFLHDHAVYLASPEGRLEAKRLLVQYKQEVKIADVVANRILDLFLKKYGTSVQDLKRNADRLWSHMNPTKPNGISEKH